MKRLIVNLTILSTIMLSGCMEQPYKNKVVEYKTETVYSQPHLKSNCTSFHSSTSCSNPIITYLNNNGVVERTKIEQIYFTLEDTQARHIKVTYKSGPHDDYLYLRKSDYNPEKQFNFDTKNVYADWKNGEKLNVESVK